MNSWGGPPHTRAQLVWTMPIRNSIGNRMTSLVTAVAVSLTQTSSRRGFSFFHFKSPSVTSCFNRSCSFAFHSPRPPFFSLAASNLSCEKRREWKESRIKHTHKGAVKFFSSGIERKGGGGGGGEHSFE